jgi:hypothetical protein
MRRPQRWHCAPSRVSGAVHMNFQHIGVGDFDAVDGDFRQSEQA